MTKTIKEKDIVDGLRSLGLETGAVVIAHSALSSFGEVAGGADTIIDALLKVVGAEGTVVMPTFSAERPFNPKTSTTFLGTVPETFRKRKDSVRSLHPLVPLSAIGKNAGYIVEGHEKSEAPQGMESPYGKIVELDGYILLLGVDLDRCTMMHTFEILANAPYLSQVDGEFLDGKGRKVRKTFSQFPGPHRDFIGLTTRFEKAGIIRKTKIGRAVVRLIRAKDMIAEGLRAMEENPTAVLCENPNCADCVTQRGKVYRDRLSRENFKLSAVSDCAGRYIDEIIENLSRHAIQHLEIYHIEGKELFQLDPKGVDHIFRRLEKHRITVSGIKVSHISRYDLTRKIAGYHKVSRIIIPMSPDAGDKIASPRGITTLLENVGQLSSEACEILKKNQGNFGLAFNPFNFARIKEKPFLQSLSKGRVKKYVRQLYINDLISILRCSSFDGYFVLDGAPGGFGNIVKRFWELLDQI